MDSKLCFHVKEGNDEKPRLSFGLKCLWGMLAFTVSGLIAEQMKELVCSHRNDYTSNRWSFLEFELFSTFNYL